MNSADDMDRGRRAELISKDPSASSGAQGQRHGHRTFREDLGGKVMGSASHCFTLHKGRITDESSSMAGRDVNGGAQGLRAYEGSEVRPRAHGVRAYGGWRRVKRPATSDQPPATSDGGSRISHQ